MGSRLRLSDKKTLHVTNTTESKVVCTWSVPSEQADGEPQPPAFAVYPESQDIAPGKTAEFRVAFRPAQDNYYYCVEATAYVSVKSNRTFRLVNDAAFVPPWFVGVRLRGHTFAAGAEQFLPKVRFRVNGAGRRLEFPACHEGDSVYQTILLENISDTPAQFHFNSDPSSVFTAKPDGGLIGRNQMQLVALRYTPSEVGSHTHMLECILNNSSEDVHTLELSGGCFLPKVLLGEESGLQGASTAAAVRAAASKMISDPSAGPTPLPEIAAAASEAASTQADVMYFKPTCVGLVSERSYTIRNPSRVPLTYQWQVPARLASVLRVTPSVGRLMGNESVTTRWSFAPRAVQRYAARVPLLVRSVNVAQPVQRLTLTTLAEGTSGAVEFQPSSLAFGTALVGTETTRELVLMNSSDCDVAFELELIRTDDTVEHHLHEQGSAASAAASQEEAARRRAKAGDLPLLDFTRPSGLLPARSRLVTVATFRPKVRGDYSFRILCRMRSAVQPSRLDSPDNSLARSLVDRADADQSTTMVLWESGVESAAAEAELALSGESLECSAVGAAAYPVLAVDDARSSGTSTAQLWRQMQLSALNRALRTPLTPAEVRYSQSTGMNQLESKDADFNDPLQRFELMFTPSLYGSPAEIVLLQLRNCGHLPVSFNFKFPDDLDVELEPWADAGEPTADELQQSAILDAKIFEVQPRSGSLGAGEAMTDYEGEHEVVVLFTLTNGKQTRLALRGRTLGAGLPFMHVGLSPPKWTLAATRIGQRNSPTESFDLFNPSPAELEYSLDISSIEALCEDNWGFPVLQCLNPNGTIPGGGSVQVQLRFSPLEPKQYTCALAFRYSLMGDSTASELVVGLTGVGYHPREGIESAYSEAEATDISAGNSQETLQPPERQLLQLPGQLASLSVDRIRYGEVPRGAKVVLISMLSNLTATPLSFQWDGEHPQVIAGLVCVSPKAGKLEPGAFVTCKFTLLSGAQEGEEETATHTGFVSLRTDIACELRPVQATATRGAPNKYLSRRNSVSRASSVRPRKTPARNTAHQSVVGRSTASRDMRLALTAGADVERGPALESFGALDNMASIGGDPEFLTSAGGDGGRFGEGRMPNANDATMTTMGGTRALSTAGSSRFGGGTTIAGSVMGGGASDAPGGGVVYAHIEADIVDPVDFRKRKYEESHKFFFPKPCDGSELTAYIESMHASSPITEPNDVAEQDVEDETKLAAPAPEKAVLPSTQPPPPAPLAPPDTNTDSCALEDELMGLLLRDVLADPTVRHTMSQLPEETTPYFVQLCTQEDSAASTPCCETPPPEKRGGEDVEDLQDMEIGAELAAAEKRVREERIRRFLCMPECQNLIEEVLENTVFNLVEEAAHGDIDLTVMPRPVFVAAEKDKVEESKEEKKGA